ncbi:MAG TPA: hypothetical protein VLK22_00530 [Candidatus Udaeobacter sp.]|nr:hypothetical protein [Candidatus Udaeobacter sp.]
MEKYQNNWQQYMQVWSETSNEKRLMILKKVLSEKATYIDPVTEETLIGYDAINSYIEQTQKIVPGVSLNLVAYQEHHSISLAQWNMCVGEMVIAPGHSFARYGNNGEIIETIAFFSLPKK